MKHEGSSHPADRNTSLEYKHAGETKKFTRECAGCGNSFTVNFPRAWFGDDGEINDRALPPFTSREKIEMKMNKKRCISCEQGR